MYGYVRVGAASPELRVADCAFNVEKIAETVQRADRAGVKVVAFPELSITGYTCGDLFFQQTLLDGAEQALGTLLKKIFSTDMLIVVGMPVRSDSKLFNCAVAIHSGKILGVVPKSFLPNHKEFYEERWFHPACDLVSPQVRLCGQDAPMGTDLLFCAEGLPQLRLGIEVCADLWAVIPPSSLQALAGANLFLNLSASNELVAKAAHRRDLVAHHSSRLAAAYVYACSGLHESTTDLVFAGHSMICENGAVLAEGKRFRLDSQMVCADVDLELLEHYRQSNDSFQTPARYRLPLEYRTVLVPSALAWSPPLLRDIPVSPFLPAAKENRERHCEEVFAIQCTGLARRLLHTGIRRPVIAVSGGLDSTLALLCVVKTQDILGQKRSDVIGVTMPGFGTTGRTYRNAIALMQALGIETREVNIKTACEQHLASIGHPAGAQDVTFENAQARERTQVVMDIANMEDGLVIGTGDLSELALGFTTYNGDHMSMYNVNCSIPKTLVRTLVEWVAQSAGLGQQSSVILCDILKTPVSPELLPPGQNNEIRQITENLVGPYELHDFFLYHIIRNGFPPGKILFLAETAFAESYSRSEILKWLRLFIRRFFQQQYKRSCSPDGPKVDSVGLSPRGDWKMPSDASAALWLAELDCLDAASHDNSQ